MTKQAISQKNCHKGKLVNIAFVTKFDVNDRNARSGVPYSMFHALSKKHHVTWINCSFPQTRLDGWINFLFDQKIRSFFQFIGITFLFYNPIICWWTSHSLKKKLKAINYDIIIGTETEVFAFLKQGKPIFIRTDKIFPSTINYTIFGMPKIFEKISKRLEMNVLNNITYLLAASNWMLDESKKHYPSYIQKKIKLIETGANIDDEKIAYREHIYSQSKLKMLFIGSFAQKKGVDTAFDTMQELNAIYGIQTSLVIIGGYPGDKIATDQNVKYLKMLNKNSEKDYNTLCNELKNADILIFPTRAEYHGIVNCEAAAFGLPIFASNTGGVSTYVIDGINGHTFPISASGKDYAKKIYECLSKNQMEILSKNSRILYEKKFNWLTWERKVTELINATCNHKGTVQ